MVSRAYGTANGETIIFDHTKGDKWTATVPWTDDGEYAVELFAEDEAGNTAYLCTVLFVISGHELRGYIVPRGYAGTGNTAGYAGMVSVSEFFGRLQGANFTASIDQEEYQIQIKEGGYMIERTVCSRDGH